MVEINATYYRMPTERTIASIVERCRRTAAPETAPVTIVVKLPGTLTHELPATRDELRGRLARFASAMGPLVREAAPTITSDQAAGAIRGALLAQFPFRFHYTDANRAYLASLLEGVADATGLITFVEFRNCEWESVSVVDGLLGRGALPVRVDLPQLEGLPTSLLELPPACDTLYLRCHGRNAGMWWRGDAATRYDYRYTATELAAIATFIGNHLTTRRSGMAYVAFNNHMRGNAAANAAELRDMLADAGIVVA